VEVEYIVKKERKIMKKVLAIIISSCLLLTFFVGCTSAPPAGQTGNLQVEVGDAPASAGVDHIWITIANLETHQGGGGPWTIIDPNPPMFDLKTIEGSQAFLTSQNLDTGRYTQIRFDITDIAVQVGPIKYDAAPPDDKIRLVEPFDIVDGETTKIIVDFNASEELYFNSQGEYAFNPIIRLIVPVPGILGIVTPSMDNGEVGVEYRAGLRPQLQAIGGKKPYTWSVSSGSLPPGLTLNPSTAVISGTSTQQGTYTFTIVVADSSSPQMTDSKSFTVRINPPLSVVIVDTSLPSGEKGEPYVAVIDVEFGLPPYTFTVTKGSLPPGLDMFGYGSDGMVDISGTPTQSGDFSFSITVTDSSSPTTVDTQDFTLFIQ
jgi:hypothetical protein